MHGAEIEVAFRGHVGDVGGDPPVFAQVPDLGGGGGVVDGGQHHGPGGRVVEVGGLEEPVDVGDLLGGDAVAHFGVEAGGGRYHRYFGVGIQEVQDTTCGYLGDVVRRGGLLEWRARREIRRGGRAVGTGLTSPPPTISTSLFLTCQARIRDPPPWTSGNFVISRDRWTACCTGRESQKKFLEMCIIQSLGNLRNDDDVIDKDELPDLSEPGPINWTPPSVPALALSAVHVSTIVQAEPLSHSTIFPSQKMRLFRVYSSEYRFWGPFWGPCVSIPRAGLGEIRMR